ncbi:MAG: TrkA family potassium uptake protein [Clostridium sp.]|nr:TrkA family potassium uptake protein [Clostridium sp.]
MEDNLMVIQGDSTDEDVLESAGITYAKGLISTLPNDADNVYTVLTARSKNSDLYIVSRAIEEHADKKLMRAGANNTISPNEIGGNRMAALILRPAVISFLDVMTHAGDVVLDLESVTVEKKSFIKDKSLREAQIPQKTGLIVLAIRTKVEDNWIFNPKSDMLLQEGDIMVVLGTQEQVDKLKKLSIEKFSV